MKGKTMAEATVMCDRDPTQVATYAYQWDWGEKGVCCAEQATLLQQRASQINRTVQVYPLPRTTPEPIGRDERLAFNSKILTLEQELEEVKSRGLDLYRVNGDQVRQIQTLTLRGKEADALIKDLKGEVQHLRGKLDERDAEHAELANEIERLRTIEALMQPVLPPAPAPEG